MDTEHTTGFYVRTHSNFLIVEITLAQYKVDGGASCRSGVRLFLKQPGVAMQIQIAKQKYKFSPKLKKHIELRLRLALGRFGDRIALVTVKCVAGALNGSVQEKRCRIELTLQRQVSVEAADADVFTAVDRAVDHAVRSVARVLDLEIGGPTANQPRLVAPKV
jgi:ribosome-associated translation inhibitor RaiA